jgi:hypothetical protein
MTNLFPLPYWAPALKRVPIPLQALDEAFEQGTRAPKRRLFDECCALGVRGFLLARNAGRHTARATALARPAR